MQFYGLLFKFSAQSCIDTLPHAITFTIYCRFLKLGRDWNECGELRNIYQIELNKKKRLVLDASINAGLWQALYNMEALQNVVIINAVFLKVWIDKICCRLANLLTKLFHFPVLSSQKWEEKFWNMKGVWRSAQRECKSRRYFSNRPCDCISSGSCSGEKRYMPWQEQEVQLERPAETSATPFHRGTGPEWLFDRCSGVF